MAITRGNASTRVDNSGSASASTSWSSAPTAGQKVIVWVWGSTQSTPTVSDNGSPQVTYTLAASKVDAGLNESILIFYGDNVKPSGTYTVTVTFGAATTFSAGGLAYGNVASGGPAATNSNSGAAGTSESSGAVTNAANALYVGGNVNDANGPDTVTWGGGFTVQQHLDDGTTFDEGGGGDEINVTGSQTATVTTSNARNWDMAIATWAETAVVSGVPQPTKPKLRILPKLRGRVSERFWPQQPTPGPVRFILDRRLRRYPMPMPHGRHAEPFWPPQVAAPPPALPPDTRPPRRRLLALRRRRPGEAPSAPAVQPPPQTQRPRSKPLPIRHARTDLPLTPPPPQPPSVQQYRRRLAPYRRGKVAEPFWPQQAVPGPVRFILDRRLRRYPMPVPRGRHSEPPWPQAARPAAVPKLPAAIATPVTAASGHPRPTPTATPVQGPTGSPRPTPIATPVQTPRIIN